MNKKIEKSITILFLASLVFINLWLISFANFPWFVSSLNILFHEAGHMILLPLGQFIHVIGGTLGELTIPILFIFHFKRQGSIPGEVFAWWWLGVAFFDISVYVADARLQILPLLGGSGGIHDWNYILGKLHLLQYDTFISKVFILLIILTIAYMIKKIIDYIKS